MEIIVKTVTGRISINAIDAKAVIFSGVTSVSLDPSDNPTIKDLKQKLYEKKRKAPERQQIYVDGYLLNDDSIGLNELLEISGGFTVIMPSAQQSQATTKWITNSKNLHPKHVSNKKPARVNADRFRIYNCVDDPAIGQRTFNIIRYNVQNPGKITIEVQDGKVKVLYVEEGAEKDEKKELEGEVKVYDESKISTESSQYKKLDIVENISNLKQAVSGFTFG
jgi:hypothetical protein